MNPGEAHQRLCEFEEKCDGVKAWLQEVICRDFTKRQLKILGILHLFQLRNEKNECYIPTLNTFEVTGISRHKIRTELEKLEELNVIHWNEETNIFSLNTCPDSWKVELVDGFNPNKIQSLIDLNDDRIKTS